MPANSIFFNSHHSPIGAFASFTLGFPGSSGGFGMSLKGPANEGVYIGVESLENPNTFDCLPFFSLEDPENDADAYDVEGLSEHQHSRALRHFSSTSIQRCLRLCSDTWEAGDLRFTLYNQVCPVPDPDDGPSVELKNAIIPAVFAELTIDNREGSAPRRAFFGLAGQDTQSLMRPLTGQGWLGFAQGLTCGIATSYTPCYAGMAFQPEAILQARYEENHHFLICNTALTVVTIPAGECVTIPYVLSFYQGGPITTGIQTCYYYSDFFDSLESVCDYGFEIFSDVIENCRRMDRWCAARLSGDRLHAFSQAVKSYYGNTQMLIDGLKQPIWVVNEGEYRMMNTFDLTVDQLFFELTMNPWTVKNELDLFSSRYSYRDDIQFGKGGRVAPGGITFTHDMGAANHFTEEGRSAYELSGYSGVFSFMSAEELINWVLCACSYGTIAQDSAWLEKNSDLLCECLDSLMQRDDPDPTHRRGIMSWDSAKCKEGKEITTYDSLDASLGQARNNSYLAVKAWAAYTLSSQCLFSMGKDLQAKQAASQAERAEATLLGCIDGAGMLPAIIGDSRGARIIPVIEGLVYPWLCGIDSPYQKGTTAFELMDTLKHHLIQCLESGVCRFADGGWRLSSTSRNSWLSKIYLCQFISEHILGLERDTGADRAHWSWLSSEVNGYYAWSDQMVEGKAQGSRYYPRGVTSTLWLLKENETLTSLRESIRGAIEEAVFKK